MKRKHGLLLFIAACIPGCGEMYQGYMKRGISILTAFCAIFALAVFLEIGALAVLMLPVWLFSFFDSYNLRGQTDAQAETNPDAYLFGLSDMDSQRMSDLLRKRHSLVGWVLVLLGVYILFDTFVGRLMQLLCEWMGQWWLYDVVMRDMPRMVVTIFIIALGIWFIRGPKKAKAEDIPAFTPPAAEATQAEPAGGDAGEAETAAAEQEDGHGDE
ncbi:hypothetical protein JQM66_03120 [Oscillibacter valericigenes]|uniref:hypothetical protein n=1 Tax=Oscillibacter valericigenes TaxID=351091 RepID=UPI001F481BF4|nr:hypothetical protein [Oscillibacter valericigenes]MCF2663544.1 hypothetical protein [Oscillibacter valericigenes]